MNLTSEEWLEIKEWLCELYSHYHEQARIYENYQEAEFYLQERNKIKALLESKGQ